MARSWKLALVVPLVALACGGRSRESEARASGGAGNRSALGGSGGTGGTSATSAAGGTGGTDSSAPLPEGPTCDDWQAAKSDVASCSLISGNPCPTDLASYFASVSSSDSAIYGYVTEGCGFRWLRPRFAYTGGAAFGFDEDGNLAGYEIWSDTVWGPCGEFSYSGGPAAEPCDSVRTCGLREDAAETGDLCDCPCPDSTPGGTHIGPATCTYAVNLAGACPETLAQKLRNVSSNWEGATVLRGCEHTTTRETLSNGGFLDCVYRGEDWIGALREEPAEGGECSGVERWQTGMLAEPCDDVAPCWLGDGGAPAEPSLCTDS